MNCIIPKIFFIITVISIQTTSVFASAQPEKEFVILNDKWEYVCGNSAYDENNLPLFVKTDYEGVEWKSINSPEEFGQPCFTDIWFRTTLPDLDIEYPSLFIRLIKDMVEVFLDGKKIYSNGDFLSDSEMTYSGKKWYLFRLTDDYKNKSLVIHIRAPHKYPGIMGDVKLGSGTGIFTDLVSNNLFPVFLGFLFISSGLIFLLILFLIRQLKVYKGLLIFQLSIGLWTIVNSPLIQLVVHSPRMVKYLNNISMFIAAIGFFLLAESILAGNFKKIFKYIRYYFIVYFILSQVIDIFFNPFQRYIVIPFYLQVMCGILVFMYGSFRSFANVGNMNKTFIIGVNAYAFFAFIELARYYSGIFYGGAGILEEYYLHLGGLILFGFLTWTIIQKYVQLNRQIITTQEYERERIARDLHDEIGPRLTEIRLVSEVISRNDLSVNVVTEKLQELSAASDNVISSFREIVWALNPTNNTLEELATYLGGCTTEFLGKAEISCRLELPPEFPDVTVPYNLRRNIIMAVKELLNNVVRHSDASLVRMSLSIEKKYLKIVINDNGNGFVQDEVNPYGNGLKNIHKRIKDCLGNVTIESKINSGTNVTLTIPLSEINLV